MLYFIFHSVLFGIGLAMDAFSASVANGLNESKMKFSRMFSIAGTFGLFQFIMPLMGWLCVHTLAEKFERFHMLIPWIAFFLLIIIGGKMIVDACHNDDQEVTSLTGFGTLLLQGIATSIDALSVGFTIADFAFIKAFSECVIIGTVTFIICIGGLKIGKAIGTKLAGKASILGGIVLIVIGAEILISALLG